MARGEHDHTTLAEVPVMVYITPSFRAYISTPVSKCSTLNLWSDPLRHVKRSIAYSNLILEKNEIPVKLKLHCIEELAEFVENPNENKRLKEFLRAKESTRALLNHADIAVLMTGSPSLNGTVGCSIGGPSDRRNPPVCWVFPEDELILIHEIGHLFGCEHNREEMGDKFMLGSNYGKLLRGTNMATIMAYPTKTNDKQIPYFSSNHRRFRGIKLGDYYNDNRMQIIKTRFMMSQLGDKTGNCRHHEISCGRNCQQNCCEMQGSNNQELALSLYSITYKGSGECSLGHSEVSSPDSAELAFNGLWLIIIDGIKETEEARDAIEYFGIFEE